MFLALRQPVDPAGVISSLPETEAAPWDAGTTYQVGQEVVRAHRIYRGVTADNLGNDPLLEDQASGAARWLQRRWTNAFSAFDGVLSNVTTAASGDGTLQADWAVFGIDMTQSPLVLQAALDGPDMVILFGLEGLTVRLIAVDAADAVLYDATEAIGGRLVGTWWDYWFAPFGVARSKVVFTEVPPSAARVILAITGDEVAVGEMVIGRSYYVGDALLGAQGRSVDASYYDFNSFGVLELVSRPTRVEMTYKVACPGDYWARLKPELDRRAGTLVAAIGSLTRMSTVTYGVLGAVDWVEELPDDYEYSFTVKGVL